MAAAENGSRLTPLAVALERIARDGGREEHQIVEGRQLPARSQSPDRVLAGFRHLVDSSDDLGREALVLGGFGATRSHQ